MNSPNDSPSIVTFCVCVRVCVCVCVCVCVVQSRSCLPWAKMMMMISLHYRRILQKSDENRRRKKHDCKIHSDEVSLSCGNLLELGAYCTGCLSVSVMDGLVKNVQFFVTKILFRR